MKLTCPKCSSNETRVISVDNRTGSKGGDHIARYWKCLDCKEKYTTRERIEASMKTNTGNFKLTEHQVTQIGFNVYGLSNTEWASIYDVAPSTISAAKKRFLRMK
tara:strand:- start:502 stop:816 length:315 start_codon:yes stop_codon:yes gene_type:complete